MHIIDQPRLKRSLQPGHPALAVLRTSTLLLLTADKEYSMVTVELVRGPTVGVTSVERPHVLEGRAPAN